MPRGSWSPAPLSTSGRAAEVPTGNRQSGEPGAWVEDISCGQFEAHSSQPAAHWHWARLSCELFSVGSLRFEVEIVQCRVLAVVDRRVIRETHDLEGLVDDGSQAAEGDAASLLHHLLDDFDQDADSDGVDDLRILQIQQKYLHAVVHELIGAVGDLLSSHVVDVALRVEDGAGLAAIDGDFQFLGHDVFSSTGFSYLTMWMVVPAVPLMISTSSICASMSWIPRPRL